MKWLVSVLVLVVLVSAACGASPTPASGLPGSKAGQSQATDSAGARGEVPPVAPAAAPTPAPAATSVPPALASAAGNAAPIPWDRMIIRDVSLVLTVRDVEEGLAGARTIAITAGGYLTKSDTRYQNDQMSASFTIQVPTANFDDVVQRLRGLAVRVESEVGGSQDVTEEYVDLDSQVRTLQATEQQLLKVMEKATTVADIMAVQREITGVRGQIEKAQGRMNYLKRLSDMATINVTLRKDLPTPTPTATPTPTPVPGWDAQETFDDSFKASVFIWQRLADLFIWLLVLFWWVVPVGGIAWLIIRSQLRKPPAGFS